MILRLLRLVLAIVCFSLITFAFLRLGITDEGTSGADSLCRFQFIPALLAGTFIIVGILLAVTLIFGRVYCSVLCPLGILQDIINRLAKVILKKRNHYHPGHLRLRITFFMIAIILGIVSSSILGQLDPYSIYGRITANCFSPIWRLINNFFAVHTPLHDTEMLYQVPVFPNFSLLSFLVAITTLGVIGYIAFRYGRLYCNSVCPLGTLLGYLSKFSFFRIWIDSPECVSCGRCSRNCKSHCINLEHKVVELDRCVACMDCLLGCPKNAISYRPFFLTQFTGTPIVDQMDDQEEKTEKKGHRHLHKKHSQKMILAAIKAAKEQKENISRRRKEQRRQFEKMMSPEEREAYRRNRKMMQKRQKRELEHQKRLLQAQGGPSETSENKSSKDSGLRKSSRHHLRSPNSGSSKRRKREGFHSFREFASSSKHHSSTHHSHRDSTHSSRTGYSAHTKSFAVENHSEDEDHHES